MIKVLNVMEDGRIAGPQLRMLKVASALKGKIETVIAIPSEPPFDFRELLIESDISYVELPLTKLSRKPLDIAKSVVRTPVEIFKMTRFIRLNDIDVVHSSGGAWMFKAIIAARLSGTASVWHLNDTSSPSVFRIFARFLMNWWVTGVIVAGSRVRSHYLSDYDTKYKDRFILTSIDAPVDTKICKPSIKEHQNNVLKVITVGNITPVKDYATIVRCLSLVEKIIQVEWTIVGATFQSQAKYREQLDSLVKNSSVSSLRFVGSQSSVHEFLCESDVYVCSSAAEASPTAVWEAMSCGLPIVSTDVGCVSDHISDGKNGYIVRVGNEGEMSDRLIELSQSVKLRREMGELNRKIAIENFDISVCVQLHSDIYRAVKASVD